MLKPPIRSCLNYPLKSLVLQFNATCVVSGTNANTAKSRWRMQLVLCGTSPVSGRWLPLAGRMLMAGHCMTSEAAGSAHMPRFKAVTGIAMRAVESCH